eukprot:2212003-Heterocapsa_arctica.AAC.1
MASSVAWDGNAAHFFVLGILVVYVRAAWRAAWRLWWKHGTTSAGSCRNVRRQARRTRARSWLSASSEQPRSGR